MSRYLTTDYDKLDAYRAELEDPDTPAHVPYTLSETDRAYGYGYMLSAWRELSAKIVMLERDEDIAQAARDLARRTLRDMRRLERGEIQ